MSDAKPVTPKRWDALPRTATKPGLQQAAFRGDDVLLVMNDLAADFPVNIHSHPFEQITQVLEGNVEFHVGGQVFQGGPGTIIRFPAGVPHATAPTGGKPVRLLDIFAPARADYLFLASHQDEEFAPVGESSP